LCNKGWGNRNGTTGKGQILTVFPDYQGEASETIRQLVKFSVPTKLLINFDPTA